MPSSRTKIMTTGITGLDTMLGGGIPAGSLIMLVGAPGTGKTIFIQQLCFTWARRQREGIPVFLPSEAGPPADEETAAASRKRSGKKDRPPTISKALYFSTYSEPHDKLLQHIGQLEFFDENLLVDYIRFLSLTSVMEEGLQKAGDLIVETARREGAGLVAIDGFRALEGLVDNDDDLIRRFLYRLSAQLNLIGTTCLISLERNLQGMPSEGDLTIGDGIIGLYNRTEGVQEYHRAEVRKMRGMNRRLGLHTYQLTQSGISFYPRLESQLSPMLDPGRSRIHNARLNLGLPQLEEMLGGGLPHGSVTLVAGSPGVGKTLLGLKYLMAGVQKGEKGLFVGFHENLALLKGKAARFDLDLAGAIDSGLITMRLLSPVEVEPDIFAAQLVQEIKDGNIQRLVVDSVVELERVCAAEKRSYDYLSALVVYLRDHNVTSMFSHTISKIIGVELDLGQTPLSLLAENLLLLRKKEIDNQFYRVISVLQMRDSDYDRRSREFTIEDGIGITILEQEDSRDRLA